MPRVSGARLGAATHVIVEQPVYPCAIAWSPSGTLLALGGDDGSVVLLSPDGTHVHSLRAHAGPVQSLAWHPERDDLVTTGQDGSVRLWRPPFEGARVLVEPGPTWVDLARWSPDGRRVAVAVGARAHLIELDGPTTPCEAVESSITGLAFSPDGKSVAVACYGGVRLFDASTGARTRRLDWKGSMVSLAFSPSGSIVACGCQDHSVHFWRIASGKDAQMSGYPAKPAAISFTHDGGWLATVGDSTISLWPFDKRGPEGRTPLQLAS
ncbi:MAG TPA: hypothetical protein VK427_04465, partial [Kofleriaceae bacterium]|nr:hypothetical protein [Kofleriaceae bacterium]